MNEQRKAFEAWATSYEDAWNEYGMRRNADDEYEQDQVRMQWEGWQAAIASQAPRQALTDARIHEIATEHGMYEQHDNARPSADTVESFAKSIEAACGPNAALVVALKAMVADFDGCYAEAEPAMIKARAALAAVGEGK